MITRVPKLVDTSERLLAPIIEERRKCLEMYGDEWADKPVGTVYTSEAAVF